jgi:uncharacterized protein YbcI
MNYSPLTMTAQVAHTVRDFQQQRTGHTPKSVTVVLSEGVMLVTLHEALTPAEIILCQTDKGLARLRDFHRDSIRASLGPLGTEIERIAGVALQEVVADIEPATGDIVHIFTTGTLLQVFKLTGCLSAETWVGSERDPA